MNEIQLTIPIIFTLSYCVDWVGLPLPLPYMDQSTPSAVDEV